MTFHRGHWCPYCRINIKALVEAHNALPAGAEIVAIKPDRRKFVAESIACAVPDPHRKLTFWVGAEIQKMMEGRRLDLPTF